MTKPKDPAEHKKPGPKKSKATIDREKKEAANWTKAYKKARKLYIELPYMLPLHAIAHQANTTVENIKKWETQGNWYLVRLQFHMALTEQTLRDQGLDLASVHINCLMLFVEAINASATSVQRERSKMSPNFMQMREAIATAAMAEEQIRHIHQWMPTVEQRKLIWEMIGESTERVRDMIKEYMNINEPAFSTTVKSDRGAD